MTKPFWAPSVEMGSLSNASTKHPGNQGALSSTGFRMFRTLLSKAPSAPERCEMCRMEIEEGHRHLADIESRQILCACRACSLLFYNRGASQGRYRVIPERIIDLRPDDLWRHAFEALDVPVSVIFFFYNAAQEQYVGLYPGPAGATECLLSTEEWKEFADHDPSMKDLEPDIEAVIIHSEGTTFSAYIAPLDLCYRLVGTIRKLWRGFDGGSEARVAIAEFFNALDEKAEPFEAVKNV